MANITAGAMDPLQPEIGSKVSQPGEPGYEEAVNIWNHAIPARPAVVAVAPVATTPLSWPPPSEKVSTSPSAAADTTST
jgi:hypothetical protein